jgi:hypothetical protein
MIFESNKVSSLAVKKSTKWDTLALLKIHWNQMKVYPFQTTNQLLLDVDCSQDQSAIAGNCSVGIACMIHFNELYLCIQMFFQYRIKDLDDRCGCLGVLSLNLVFQLCIQQDHILDKK